MITFDGTVQALGERLLILLPEAASAELPSRGQVAAVAHLDGHEVNLVIEPDGRRGHWISLTGDLCHELAVEAGQSCAVELTPTKDWPEPAVPDDLQTELDGAPDIAGVWTSITPMARWEWVRWVQATRNPETRARRVEVTISKMRHGKRRPCCFDLSSCTDPELSKSGKLIDLA